MINASRYHDISCGHRVVNHESKCAHLHGHNYRVHFHVAPLNVALDDVGRVLDFSVIKSRLCMWLEDMWDHKMLIYVHDPMLGMLSNLDPLGVVAVPFNPTAENMAQYLLDVVGPAQLVGTHTTLVAVEIEETRKCSAAAALDD